MSFEFIEHTADIRVVCCAPTYAGLLEEAARALYATALDHTGGVCSTERMIVVRAANAEERLVRWLQEILFLLDTEGFVATRFAFTPRDGGVLSVQAGGYLCAPAARVMEIKGATYHGLEIEESDGGWSACIVFDV